MEVRNSAEHELASCCGVRVAYALLATWMCCRKGYNNFNWKCSKP